MIEGTLAAQSDTPNKLYEIAINQYMRGGLSNRGSSLKIGVMKSPFSSILNEAYAYFGSSGGKRENEEIPVTKNNAQIESNRITTPITFKVFFIVSKSSLFIFLIKTYFIFTIVTPFPPSDNSPFLKSFTRG